MELLPNIGVGETGPVDLDNLDCRGCRHKSLQVCKRFPPVFTSAIPRMDPVSREVVGMTQGGWSFPPAIRKCGEFQPRLEG